MMSSTLCLERNYPPRIIVPQTVPLPRLQKKPLAKKRLPTMYDLPSEAPEEGLPDDFHYHQPQLLRETFRPPHYSPSQIYTASDLYLYYDEDHHKWYKRPDWFAVLGVPPLYQGDMRYSYVMWEEKVTPFIIIELLSESTEKEDLGLTTSQPNKPPTKWDVYETRLKVPYYIVFNRKQDQFRAFELIKGHYREIELDDLRLWFPKIQLGLAIWKGLYHQIDHQWLRWYDTKGQWVSTPIEVEKDRADSEKQRADVEAQARLLEKQRAETEKQRADSEAQARLLEKQRADSAETELARLKALLAEKGVPV